MKSTRLAGHTLPGEGQVYDRIGRRIREGATKCSCGEESPVLPSPAARKKWHREHKENVKGASS